MTTKLMVMSTFILFVTIVAETLYLRSKSIKISWKEIIVNVNSGGIPLWVARGTTALIHAWIAAHSPLAFVSNWTPMQQFAFTFIAWDFCYYWFHRVHHQIPFLWKIHSMHHQGEHFGLSLAVRNHWFQPFTAFPFFIPLAIVGVPVLVLGAVAGMHLFVQFYNHNNVAGSQGILELFMVTPQGHRVHHGMNPEYIDKNFSGTFMWDRLFGTHQPWRNDINIRYGTGDGNNSDNVFLANVLPLTDYFKIRINKLNKNQFDASTLFLVAGVLLSQGLLVVYISIERSWPFSSLCYLGTFIFAVMSLLGSVAQGSVRGLYGYCMTTLLGFLLMYALELNAHPYLFALSLGLVIHALFGVKRYALSRD